MRTILLATAALITFVAAPAHAADMRPVLYKAPPPAPATYNWTGCYVGIQGGGGVLYDGLTLENGGGALAGGQFGCNRQIGQFVLGVEAEGWWSGLQSTFNLSGGGFVTESLATNNRWDADVAVRAGIAVDNVLIYGKAGGAAGGFDFTFNEPPFVVGNASGTLGGLLLGGGFEYAFSPVWSAKVEYNYIDYIHHQFTFSNSTLIYPLGASEHLLKAGINYKFSLASQ